MVNFSYIRSRRDSERVSNRGNICRKFVPSKKLRALVDAAKIFSKQRGSRAQVSLMFHTENAKETRELFTACIVNYAARIMPLSRGRSSERTAEKKGYFKITDKNERRNLQDNFSRYIQTNRRQNHKIISAGKK